MTKIPRPLQGKRSPKSVNKPPQVAQEAANGAKAVRPAAKKRASATAKPAAKRAAVARKSPTRRVAAVEVVIEQVIAKPAKVHKPKLVRDSFTIPKDEYQVLAALKMRALGHERHVRKSELLRAGIQALQAMDDRAFLEAVAAVPTLKTGRPKSA